MKPIPRITTVFVTAAMVPLVSCSAVRNASRNSAAAVKNSTSAAASKISSLAKMPDLGIARLLPGGGVKVVEVREKDLREMPTGHELARAHAQRRSGFWIFGGPVDFKEPTLPEPGAELDGSLLPPLEPDPPL